MAPKSKSSTSSNYSSTLFFSFLFCLLIGGAIFSIMYYVPELQEPEIPEILLTEVTTEENTEEDLDISEYIHDYVSEVTFQSLDNVKDKGLTLYRQSMSRVSVEIFYTNITGNKDVTNAILTYAEKNDIPLSLAFALAYTESKYKVNAVGHNTNGTTDRGLFQLNSNTFPKLTEEDFFDPYTSAKYGLAHLKQCLRSAGNSVSALAMYNAGQGRVSSNKTPQITLNYIGKIISYQNKLEQQFTDEVVIFYETQLIPVK
ncbi:MAG: lytic transglycosylase domain-containing protein [Treponema sp.]|nr:lytic transglycosylase domain-containing protein [Treponema sp.]